MFSHACDATGTESACSGHSFPTTPPAQLSLCAVEGSNSSSHPEASETPWEPLTESFTAELVARVDAETFFFPGFSRFPDFWEFRSAGSLLPKVVGVAYASRPDPKVVGEVPTDECPGVAGWAPLVWRYRCIPPSRLWVSGTPSPGNDWRNEPEERGVGCQPYLGPRDVLPVGPQSGSDSSLSRLDPQVVKEVRVLRLDPQVVRGVQHVCVSLKARGYPNSAWVVSSACSLSQVSAATEAMCHGRALPRDTRQTWRRS